MNPGLHTIFHQSLAILTSKERLQFKLLALFNLLTSLVDIATLAVLLLIVDFYANSGESVHFNLLPAWMINDHSLWLLFFFLILFSTKNILAFFIYRRQFRFIGNVSNRLSATKLENYLSGDFTNYINTDSSEQIRRISYQPTEFCYYVLSAILQIFTEFILVSLAILGIALYDPDLFFLLSVVLLPPVIIVFYLIRKRLRSTSIQGRTSSEKSLQHLREALHGYIESNIYDKKHFFLKRYTHFQQQFNQYLSESMIIQGMPHRIIEVFAVTGLFLLIAFTRGSSDTANANLVQIGAFMAAAYKIIPGVVRILNLSGQTKIYGFTLENLSRSTPLKKGSGKTPNEMIQTIEFKNVCFGFNDRDILLDFNLKISAGELIGMKGYSGLGKTTMINLLLGLLTPRSGEILYNNRPLDPESRQSFWPMVSYVKQEHFLLHDTIQKNITLDDDHYDPQRLEKVIQMAGLDDLLGKYPEGERKIITENGKSLSGGQRQRIAIARALYKDPQLVILDEAFNELDEDSEERLLTEFGRLAENGKMVLLVSHRQKGLAHCSKIITFDA